MKTLLAFVAAIGIAASPIALAAEKYDPFNIDERAFKKEYRRIALAPVEAGTVLDMPDAAKQMIEEDRRKCSDDAKKLIIP